MNQFEGSSISWLRNAQLYVLGDPSRAVNHILHWWNLEKACSGWGQLISKSHYSGLEVYIIPQPGELYMGSQDDPNTKEKIN